MVDARDVGLGLSRRMKATHKSCPSRLGFLFAFCLAALSGCSACPKLCACYVPTEVHCTFRYLTTIPPRIPPNVVRINLGYNSLVKLTENDLSGLEKLELLLLHSNQIHTIHNRTFSNLHLLQVLKMSYNKVKVIQSDTFHGLKSLLRLHMDHNQIEFINPQAFYGLTSLRLVHLEGNLLRQLHSDTFVTLRYVQIFKTSSIKHIYLSDNILTSLPQDIFSYMSELETVYLHGNPWICDCRLQWFAEWAEQHPDAVKCKKDRSASGFLQCPLCVNPRNSKGKQLAEMSSLDFNCFKPTIHAALKFKNITVPDDGDFTSISSKDFIAPIGSMLLNMTDQAGNQANLACSVQKPTNMSSVKFKRSDHTVLEVSLSTFLVCSIAYEHIQQLWSIIALYSDSPLKLKRDLLLSKVPRISYKYKQINSENEDVFTNIKAELRSDPPWLMQDKVSLQLDRTATTLNTLHIHYLVDAQMTLPVPASQPKKQNWALISRNNSTNTEFSVLLGGSVELDCHALGEPPPVIEWVLPDGSKVRAPYISADGRIMIAKTGTLALHTADNYDTGVYHCVGTNYDDADVLSFRITVLDPYMEYHQLNGPQLSAFLGDTLYLPCQATAVPDASINWILPEHLVLHRSSRNKVLFHNGTLKLQPITDQDAGYFKCVTVNQYGVDFLVYQVIVNRNSNISQNQYVHIEKEVEEGSGNEGLVIARPPNPPSTVQTQVTTQEFTQVSSKSQSIQKRTQNNYRESYRHNRDKTNRQFKGQRRQYSSSTRKIDPLRWAAFLEKTKNSTLSRKQENTTVKPTVKVLLSSKMSRNEEMMSGDDMLPEEELMLLATKRPPLYTLGEVSGNVVTAELGSISSHYNSTDIFGLVMETVTLLARAASIDSERPKAYTEFRTETSRTALEAFQTPPTGMKLSPSNLPNSTADFLNTSQRSVSSGENDLHADMKQMITPEMDAFKSTRPATSHKGTGKSDLFVEATEKISRKPNLQVSAVTVGVPDGILRPVSVYSTQKITPQISANPTIFTYQQIKTVKDTRTHAPFSRRYGRRRKISGRRRIASPDQIPNSVTHRFAFVKQGLPQNTTLPPPIGADTATLTIPNQSPEQITSQTPISTLFKRHHPAATTTNQLLAFSLHPENKLVGSEKHTTSTVMPFDPESIRVISHRKFEASTTFQTVSDANSSFNMIHPTVIINSTREAVEATFNTSNVAPSSTESASLMLRNNSPSSVSTEENHWHHGSTHVQKELLKKQPRLQISAKPSTEVPIMPLQTIVPTATYGVSPVHKAAASKSENGTYSVIALIKPMVNDALLEIHFPAVPLGITELPPKANISSAANLNKDVDGTSIKPILAPATAALSGRRVSKPRVLRLGRRRGQRRKRPLKRIMPLSPNVTVNKGAATQFNTTTVLSTLAPPKEGTKFSDSVLMELLSLYSTSVTTTQPLILSTTDTTKGTVAASTQQMAKNATTGNIVATKLLVDNPPSEKPTPMIPLSLSPLSRTTALPATSLVTVTPVATKLTHTVTAVDLNENAGEKAVHTQHTTELMPLAKSELTSNTLVDARYTTALELDLFAFQTVAMPRATVTTSFPRWMTTLWHEPSSKVMENGKPITMNTLTTMKAPPSSTQSTPAWENSKNSYIKAGSERMRKQESTTTSWISVDSFYQTRLAKPRIIGGKLAAFTVLANSDAFIPCEATGNPWPTIHWTKVSAGINSPKHKKDNRLEVLLNGTLSIPNVTIQDRGQYLCMASNQHGSDRLLITLSVVAYPPRILEGKFKVITVHSGKSVNMKCTAEGHPAPTIFWILANKTHVSEYSVGSEAISVKADGTLMLKKASVYDRGIYACVANNPAGSDTMTVRLQVIAAPPSILEKKRQYMPGNMGESLLLPCTANGNPHPNVHWVFFDGTVVKSLQYKNDKFFLFPNGTLYIKNLAPLDSGNYECIATSSTGSERRVVTLHVEHRDTIPRIEAASERLTQLKFGNRLLLNCSAVGEPKPRIIWRLPSKAVVDQWHRMGSRIHVYPNGSLAIDGVTEKDAGDYLCVARNKMGDDLILMTVSVTMKPAKIDQKQYFKKLVPYGKDFKVDCKASGSPEPEITWSLPDGTMVNNVMQADDSGRRHRRYILFDNGTLYFNKVGIAEEGDYTCYAQNTLGKDEMKVHLTVMAMAPRIKQNSKSYEKVKAGNSVLFDCEAIGEPKPKIFWFLPSSDMILASAGRYSLHVNGSLSVTKVKLLDAGEYICVARNSGGDDTKLYTLEVVSKPPLINGLFANKTVIKTTAIKHSKKQMDCRAEGTPLPQIMWIMPDNIFLTAPYYGSRVTVHKNGTLEIRNVRTSDTAEFICVARNDGGESILVVQLEVLEMLRRPMFRNPFNEKIIAKPGKTALMNCSVDGNPPPEIIWTLPNGTRLAIGVRTDQYYMGSNGTLVIFSPSKDNVGKYRCAAKNQMGYIEKVIILEISLKPTIFTHSRGTIKSIGGETLSLHCLADGNPKPNIIWTVPSGFVLDHPQINGKYMLLENGTLVIRETSIQDRGSYACKAQNYAGDSTVVVFVMVVVQPPRITNRLPRNIRTVAGIEVQLNCMALGTPNPEITWELPDHSLLSTGNRGRSSGSELLHPQGTLVIRNPTSSNSGTYKCMAKNQFGSDSTVTYVQVI